MADKLTSFPILSTKLHRPATVRDLVPRTHLLDLLEQHDKCPLTLVSAPAGYGKSTLLSNWLEVSDRPGAWLSLDEDDSDPGIFLNYMIAAVQTLFPGACHQTLSLLQTAEMPPIPLLTGKLLNELAEIEDTFILVLDDYGSIRNPDIHELLSLILKHPLRNLHLVILTRRDPPLSLNTLRAKGMLNEIRQADLHFTISEISVFLQKTINISIDEKNLLLLHQKTEGWAAVLRMLSITLRNRPDINEFIREIGGGSKHIRDYLIAEVLSTLKPEVGDCLLKTSILNRFCAPLIDTLCEEIEGQAFLRQLEEANLLCISLDNSHEWFRFHHLFQELLQQTLKLHYSPEEIASLHTRACEWFNERGMVEEALHHALAVNNSPAAINVVTRWRNALMNREEFKRLRLLLHRIPRHAMQKEPELLMISAWALVGLPEMAQVLDRIETLMSTDPERYPRSGQLWGEYCSLRSNQYMSEAKGEQTIDVAMEALRNLPAGSVSARGFATIHLSIAHQMTGDTQKARSIIFEALEKQEAPGTTFHSRMLAALCFIDWIEGDIERMQKTAVEYIHMGKELDLAETIAHGLFFLGIISYKCNRLVEADQHLSMLVHDILTPYLVNQHNYLHGAIALSLTLHALGKTEEASEIAKRLAERALKAKSPYMLNVANAFQAELALRQGRLAEAEKWSKTFDPYPFRSAYRFYVPQLTLAKTYLAENTAESIQRAGDLLVQLSDFFSTTHNTNFMIDVLALQSLLHDSRGEEPAATEKLTEALKLAEPGGFIRNFLDLGPEMADLLSKLTGLSGSTDYILRILDAFRNETVEPPRGVTYHQTNQLSSLNNDQLIDPLSRREIEVLTLLIQRLSNKEVAEKLFISPDTVKKHTINLYQKLQVNSRREAVVKAKELGIILIQ